MSVAEFSLDDRTLSVRLHKHSCFTTSPRRTDAQTSVKDFDNQGTEIGNQLSNQPKA